MTASSAEPADLRNALERIIKATHSHIDGRDLLAELHPRRMLDIKRRVDGVETWFQGDWLSNLWTEVKAAREVLAATPAAVQPETELPGSPAHSLGGFRGGFYGTHGRHPTDQEIWNAAIRSWRDLHPDGAAVQQGRDDSAVFEKLGREMYAMTTTVHSPSIPFAEACACIPVIWENFVQERNRHAAAELVAASLLAVPLSVWYGSMPESNGKKNWTAILHRGDFMEGITIARSEYPDRVRYEADRMRHLIGELPEAPDILAYDADLCEAGSASTSEPAPQAVQAQALEVLKELVRWHYADVVNTMESGKAWARARSIASASDAAPARRAE